MSVTTQPLRALDRANEVRAERTLVRSHLSAYRTRQQAWQAASQLIETTPDTLETMTVEALLCACYGTGEVLARTVLRKASVGVRKQLGSLTDRQRTALVEALRGER
jgi:hypothetical protein